MDSQLRPPQPTPGRRRQRAYDPGTASPPRTTRAHSPRRRPAREGLPGWRRARAKPGDLVFTLGAGNIQLTFNEVIDLLEKRLGAATKKNLVRVQESSATVAR